MIRLKGFRLKAFRLKAFRGWVEEKIRGRDDQLDVGLLETQGKGTGRSDLGHRMRAECCDERSKFRSRHGL